MDLSRRDHPVCIHKPAAPVNADNSMRRGLGWRIATWYLPLSSKVCLIGRMKGEGDSSFILTGTGSAKRDRAAGHNSGYVGPMHVIEPFAQIPRYNLPTFLAHSLQQVSRYELIPLLMLPLGH